MVVYDDLQDLGQLSICAEVGLLLFLIMQVLTVLVALSIRWLIAAVAQTTDNLTDLRNVIDLDVPPILDLLKKGLILTVLLLQVPEHGQPHGVVGLQTVTDEM